MEDNLENMLGQYIKNRQKFSEEQIKVSLKEF
jgi:hypothetical protein